MPEWIVTIIVTVIVGLFGLASGIVGMWRVKRYNPEYLRYLDERRQAECQHIPVEGYRIEAFCEKCKKTLSEEEVARQRILDCEHVVAELRDDEHFVTYICAACGRTAMMCLGRHGSGLTLGLTGRDAFKMICRPGLEMAHRVSTAL